MQVTTTNRGSTCDVSLWRGWNSTRAQRGIGSVLRVWALPLNEGGPGWLESPGRGGGGPIAGAPGIGMNCPGACPGGCPGAPGRLGGGGAPSPGAPGRPGGWGAPSPGRMGGRAAPGMRSGIPPRAGGAWGAAPAGASEAPGRGGLPESDGGPVPGPSGLGGPCMGAPWKGRRVGILPGAEDLPEGAPVDTPKLPWYFHCKVIMWDNVVATLSLMGHSGKYIAHPRQHPAHALRTLG